MDYEKKYKEALERANKQRADYQKELDKTDKNSQLAGLLRAGISAIDMAFPELAESDERIRKDIINLIYWLKGNPSLCSQYYKDRYDGMLSWLEKQKDKTTAEEFENLELFHLKLKEAKENKYIRAQLLWELMHNGIITEVDYQYLTDENRKPWTEEEYRKAHKKGFEASEQLKHLGM